MIFSLRSQQKVIVRSHAPRRGVAMLLVVLGLLTIGTLLLSAGVFLVGSETRAVVAARASSETISAADAGAEDAIMHVRENFVLPGTYTIAVGNATATVTSTVSGSSYDVVSDGARSLQGRTVEVKFVKSNTQAQFFYGVQVEDGGLVMGSNATVSGNIYSDGNISGSNGAAITGTAIVAGGLSNNPSIEWTVNDADQFFATTSSNRDIAQSFTAASSGIVNKVSMYLGKVGSPSSNLTVRIHNDNGNKPATSSLASETLPPAVVGTVPAWIDIPFSSPPNLTNGTKYWIVLDYNANSATNYWNWRKDSSDAYANNTGKYTSNCCSGNPTWTDVGGDLAFRVWIGGVNKKIDGVTVGNVTSGTGRANLFVNDTIHGTSCPNQYCIVDNPAHIPLPITQAMIDQWKIDAAAGGTCGPPQCDGSGNLTLSGVTSMGPKKIAGDVSSNNGAVLTVTGTLWITGTLNPSNNCIVKLDPSYGANSGIIIVDNLVNLSNNCTFVGSGDPNSYIMILDDKNTPASDVMDISNNSSATIFYASTGRIHFNNNSSANEATAYGIDLDNNAAVIYQSGLANVNFSSGPSGGYVITLWHEIAL